MFSKSQQLQIRLYVEKGKEKRGEKGQAHHVSASSPTSIETLSIRHIASGTNSSKRTLIQWNVYNLAKQDRSELSDINVD